MQAKYFSINFFVSFIYLILFACPANSQPINYNSFSDQIPIGKQMEVLNDKGNNYNESSVLNAKNFYISKDDVPLFATPNVNTWFKFSVINNSFNNLYLFIDYSNISSISLYKAVNHKLILLSTDGSALYHEKKNNLPTFIFDLSLQPKNNAAYYLHITSTHPLVLSSYIGSYSQVQDNVSKQIFVVSAYFGVMAVIFLYNLFLFFSTKDWNYFIYISYIFCLALAQLTLAGYSFKFLWLAHPVLNYYAVPVTSNLTGVMGIAFSLQFLRIKYYLPRFYKLLVLTEIIFIIGIICSLIHNNTASYFILNFNSPVVGILSLSSAIYIASKKYRPALYYAISWIFFLGGLVLFSLRNIGFIPINSFTTHILYFGSALEVTLLSIALADRINTLKKEKETMQAEALERAKENERLVKDQNVILEQKVDQRTYELKESNQQLNFALDNLKDAQTQLVEAEKMASLGQLTAGIAHEINNPINFVKSNINPLRLDVRDLVDVLNEYEHLHNLKEEATYRKKLSDIEKFKNQIDVKFVQNEINSLIVGIEEGAQRTAEIVQGLRTFSRIDEAELKTVDIHDGILSTLVILKNSTPFYIKIKKQFNAKGNVECYPGKLNQVFMNIITNAVQAITAKTERSEEEMITIFTRDIENDFIQISVKDTGIGMTEETKHRVFEPFFTTKDVGEGTGLGMAIVFKIIQKHEGKIDIISKPLQGSEFILTLPYKHPISAHL